MTLEEQARALVTELWHRAQPGGYERKTLDDWKNEGTLLIATALRQQWEEAAKMVTELMGKDSGNWNRAMIYAADRLRQRAKEEGDGLYRCWANWL